MASHPARISKRTEEETSSEESSDDDRTADVEMQDIEALMDCEKQLKANPNLYDTHVQYLTLLRRSGLKEKLKTAREAFRTRFPLSETLWMEWMEDETEKETMDMLFDFALEDYLSMTIWKKRLEFISQDITSEVDRDRWREVSEQALEIAGVHFSEGHEIWKHAIDVEQRILTMLDESEQEDQIERIRQLYFDAFQVPLLKLDALLEAYAEWEQSRGSMTTEPPPQIQNQIESTRKAIEARTAFEEALNAEETTDRLGAYVAFCVLEEKHGTIRQGICIYERALAAFPVTHTLWLRYGSFLEKKKKHFESIDKLYHRATRNCPWLGILWEKRIRAAALYEKDVSCVQSIYEQALQAGLQSEEDYMVVLLAWLDFLRCDYWKRKTQKEAVSFEPLDSAFQYALSLMQSYFPKYLDNRFRIERYWAESWITIGQDIEKARAIWETRIEASKSVADCYEAWMAYIRMETTEKHHGPARKLYSRAFNALSNADAKYALVLDWLRHEGMTGTPKQYASAVNATQTFVDAYVAEMASRQNPEIASESKKKAKRLPKISSSELTDLRRHKAQFQKKQQKTEEEATEKSRLIYNDVNTLYVSRIPKGTEDDQIRDIFKDCGELEAIRHLRFANGETKGHAYVVFKDEQGMKEGLKKSKTILNGSEILIQISRPTRIHAGIPHPAFAGRGRGRGRGRDRGRAIPPEKPLSNEEFRKMLL